MSNYIGRAINPNTNTIEPAQFIDKGWRGYYVRFADGSVHKDRNITEVKTERDYPEVVMEKAA